MKVKIVIEEVISQEFEVEVSSIDDAYDEIRTMYKNKKLVVEDPKLTQANLAIIDDKNETSDWMDLHI